MYIHSGLCSQPYTVWREMYIVKIKIVILSVAISLNATKKVSKCRECQNKLKMPMIISVQNLKCENTKVQE